MHYSHQQTAKAIECKFNVLLGQKLTLKQQLYLCSNDGISINLFVHSYVKNVKDCKSRRLKRPVLERYLDSEAMILVKSTCEMCAES